MRRFLIVAAAVLVCGGLAYWLYEPPELRDPPTDSLEPEEWEFDPVDDPAPPPIEEHALAREPLPIEGRVFDGDASPVEGAVIELGRIDEESETFSALEEAATAADGSFEFPAADRPRVLAVRCRGIGEFSETWSEVIVGMVEGIAPADDPHSDRPPARPALIRWTLNIPSEASDETSERFWISPGSVIVEEWGERARIRCRGRTNLPPGAHVAASAHFDGARFLGAYDPAEVSEGGGFVVVLPKGAEGQRLFSGSYEAQFSFNPVLERPSAMAKWEEEYPSLPWESPLAEAAAKFFVGDPAQARDEDIAAQNYYRRTLAAAEDLRAAFTTRTNEIRRLGKGWSPDTIARRRAMRSGWFHEDFVLPDGSFDEAAWRRFLDREWRPTVSALLDAQKERGVQKYPDAEGKMLFFLTGILQESYIYSRFVVYPLFGLRGSPEDFFFDEYGIGDLPVLQRRLASTRAGLERFLLLVPDAPADPGEAPAAPGGAK